MNRIIRAAGFATSVSRDVVGEVVDSFIDELEGDLAFVTLEFEYQHTFTDWSALSASASGEGRSSMTKINQGGTPR